MNHNHYFSQSPDLEHQEKQFNLSILNQSMKFITDKGVFSKETMDYGSRVLVESFAKSATLNEGMTILELGSGYGPILLSIITAFPFLKGIGVEINERAHHLALKNKQLNQLEGVEFIHQDARFLELNCPVHYCLTNPPIRAGKKTIQAMVERGHQLLINKGELWVVIQKKQGAPSMKKYMETLFSDVERVNRDKGYWILRGIK